MNRFSGKSGQILKRGVIWMPPAVAAVTLLFFFMAFSGMDQDVRKKGQENLERALNRSVVLCYALEGAYPENLEYLKDHYGIRWKEEQYLVDFETVGKNLPPDITVIPRK